MTEAAHGGGAIVKVIFENCYLNDDQKIRLCQICGEVGADYVKTSTGYGTGGATDADLILMRRAVAAPRQAQGRRRRPRRSTRRSPCAELGCDRIGASRTAEILDELKARLGSAERSTWNPTCRRGTWMTQADRLTAGRVRSNAGRPDACSTRSA